MADEQTQDTQTPDANAAAGDDMATRVQVLEEQLAAANDQALRVAADLQNVRRRAEQDVEKAHKFALEKFAGDLLPIIDSLERGLELSNADDENIRPMREGIELTLKMFQDTLKRYQLEAIDPQGGEQVDLVGFDERHAGPCTQWRFCECDQMWERACSRKRCTSHLICWLDHRLREQARSHI